MNIEVMRATVKEFRAMPRRAAYQPIVTGFLHHSAGIAGSGVFRAIRWLLGDAAVKKTPARQAIGG